MNLQMIPRSASPTLQRLAKGFRVVALTGPRQSGKTTLARSEFKNKPYVSLENPDELAFATSDPATSVFGTLAAWRHHRRHSTVPCPLVVVARCCR